MLGRVIRQGAQGVALWCAAVLLLCLAHQLLMASKWHATVLAPAHHAYQNAHASPVVLSFVLASSPIIEHGQHEPGVPFLGDCQVSQAVLSIAALFSLLLVAVSGKLLPRRRGLYQGQRNLLASLIANALDGRERRAFLQVFLI